MYEEVPAGAVRVIDSLEKAGFEAYFVGGCVRDLLLGREIHDWDITTSAAPEQVKAVFSRTIDTGIQHGTVTVASGGGYYEVTTYRVDGKYLDGRHPSSVSFTPSLEEDLKRRDFTINAMAWHPKKGLVDLFEGQKDLERRVIRCVGRAADRFGEDALRMMRALRFAAQLDFSLDEEAAQAIAFGAENIKRVSRERIQAELLKLILSGHPGWLREAVRLGLSRCFLPGLTGLAGSEREWRVSLCERLPVKKHLRLAALYFSSGWITSGCENGYAGLRECGEEACPAGDRKRSMDAEKELDDLRFDNDTRTKVIKLLEWSALLPAPEGTGPKEKAALARYLQGELRDLSADLFLLMEEAGSPGIEELESLAGRAVEKGECTSLRELAVSGKDLMAGGIPAGKHVGECLKHLLWTVLYTPEMNRKEILLAKAAEWARGRKLG